MSGCTTDDSPAKAVKLVVIGDANVGECTSKDSPPCLICIRVHRKIKYDSSGVWKTIQSEVSFIIDSHHHDQVGCLTKRTCRMTATLGVEFER